MSKSSCKVQRKRCEVGIGSEKILISREWTSGKNFTTIQTHPVVVKEQRSEIQRILYHHDDDLRGNLLASLLLMGTQRLNGQSLETVRRRHDRVASHSLENVRPGPEVRAAKRSIVTICDGRPIRSLMQKVTARSFFMIEVQRHLQFFHRN